MRCPFCGEEDTQVRDSRPSDDGMSIRRRRICPSCNSRFTTFERVHLRELFVIKKNGDKKLFDREKITRSIFVATRKRDISQEQIDSIVNNIVHRLEILGENEISTNLIGEMVMEALKKIDKIAYIRFASVYRDFQEVDDFGKLLEQLEEQSEI